MITNSTHFRSTLSYKGMQFLLACSLLLTMILPGAANSEETSNVKVPTLDMQILVMGPVAILGYQDQQGKPVIFVEYRRTQPVSLSDTKTLSSVYLSPTKSGGMLVYQHHF